MMLLQLLIVVALLIVFQAMHTEAVVVGGGSNALVKGAKVVRALTAMMSQGTVGRLSALKKPVHNFLSEEGNLTTRLAKTLSHISTGSMLPTAGHSSSISSSLHSPFGLHQQMAAAKHFSTHQRANSAGQLGGRKKSPMKVPLHYHVKTALLSTQMVLAKVREELEQILTGQEAWDQIRAPPPSSPNSPPVTELTPEQMDAEKERIWRVHMQRERIHNDHFFKSLPVPEAEVLAESKAKWFKAFSGQMTRFGQLLEDKVPEISALSKLGITNDPMVKELRKYTPKAILEQAGLQGLRYFFPGPKDANGLDQFETEKFLEMLEKLKKHLSQNIRETMLAELEKMLFETETYVLIQDKNQRQNAIRARMDGIRLLFVRAHLVGKMLGAALAEQKSDRKEVKKTVQNLLLLTRSCFGTFNADGTLNTGDAATGANLLEECRVSFRRRLEITDNLAQMGYGESVDETGLWAGKLASGDEKAIETFSGKELAEGSNLAVDLTKEVLPIVAELLIPDPDQPNL